jgi:nitrogen fixation/metabolism regulation signal transduction histidine kinase
MRFVGNGIDSWFRADVAAAQANAEAIGHEVLASFERRARDLAGRYARQIEARDEGDPQSLLDAVLDENGEPVHLSLYDDGGELLAIAFNTSAIVFPPAPSQDERLRVDTSGQLAINERINERLVWRVIEPVAGIGVMQAVYPISGDIAARLDLLERAAVDYAQLRFQRNAMQSTFLLILGLVGTLALLGALYAALAATRRLVQPISDLALAAAEIGEGRYGRLLTVQSGDELGLLTQGFNRMSQELAVASAREQANRVEIEQSRARLEAIVERLSAGVVSFNADTIVTANQAAGELLGVDAVSLIGMTMADAEDRHPRAAPVLAFLRQCIDARRTQWREEVRLIGDPPRALLVRGTRFPGDGEASYVAVFDDAALIALSQREAAWAEVAKRLAHEIKNPLTPIQLAAERLRHKYLGKMSAVDADVLDRATQTIVSQVEALKRIVDAFGDYTRPAQGERQWFDLRTLLEEVTDLYEHSGQCRPHREFALASARILGSKERLRQALINLFTNAIEASEAKSDARVDVSITAVSADAVEIALRDYGQGLPVGFDERWFEPYNTTKPKGTGLGLAWVKKIAEEHGGSVTAENAHGGGAHFRIRLPFAAS